MVDNTDPLADLDLKQAIDLRWGVSEEAALEQTTMEICLQELERCQHVSPRPNFILLLGQRYGWRPLPTKIKATEFEILLWHVPLTERDFLLEWYKLDENAVPPEYLLHAPRADNRFQRLWATKEMKGETF